MSSHYEYTPFKEGYQFKTDSGTAYYFYFLDFSELYRDYPKIRNKVFTFSFEVINGEPDKYDLKVSETIKHVIESFFKKTPTAILTYTCDSLDGKHVYRSRLFNFWFKKHRNNLFKVDVVLDLELGKIFSSTIFDRKHRYFSNIIEAFVSTTYEINTGAKVTFDLPKLNKVTRKIKKSNKQIKK